MCHFCLCMRYCVSVFVLYEILCVIIVFVLDIVFQYCLCMRHCVLVLFVYEMLFIIIICVSDVVY